VTLPKPLRNPLVLGALATLLVAFALAAVWRWTPLKDIVTAEAVLDWVESFSGKWWAPIALAAAYTPASVVMFPRPLLTLAAVLAFGMWEGLGISLAGVVVNGLVFYFIGRQMPKEKLDRLGGPKLKRVGKLLHKDGLIAVTTVGLLPVAPFAVEALAFGALRLKLWHVVPGIVLAMLPGIIATVLLGDQLAAALSHERSINRGVILGVIVAMAAIVLLTRRWWKKLQAAVA